MGSCHGKQSTAKYSKQKTRHWEKNQNLGPCTHYWQDTVSGYNMDRVNQNQVDASDLWVHDFDTSTCCLGRDSRQAYRPWRLVINISRPSSQEILQLPWLPHHGWFDIACPFQHGSSIIANMWSSTCDSSPLRLKHVSESQINAHQVLLEPGLIVLAWCSGVQVKGCRFSADVCSGILMTQGSRTVDL